jgi:Ca2+-binding RTX toxin-like protein
MSSPSPDVTYEGGAGNDTYFLWTSTQQVVEQPNEGIDTVYIYFSNYTIPDNVENVSTEQFSGLSPKFNITGNSLDNHIIGQANDDVLLGMGGSDVLEGFWGNDVLNGGDGNDILDGHIGNDILIGGSGDNVLAGGHDIDTADYSSDPAGITMNLTMQGQNTTNGWGGLDTLTSIENVIGTSFADNIIANGANNVITTGGGNDVINGGAGNDTIIAGMGEVSFQGGVGNDTFVMGATWDTGDLIDGGSGIDTISLSGDYSAGVAVSLDMMSHVEVISLGAGFSYNFTFANNDVGPGLSLTIDGSALGAGDSLTVNAFHDTDSIYIVKGGAGNDNIETGQGNDIISAGSGGTDIIDAQGGNDTIDMGAGLDSTDTIDGGTGTDTVTLEGDYSAGFTFGNTTMLNVENLVLGAGFSYNLTFANSTVAAGTTFTVDASKLGAANSLVFSGQHESDGQFDIIGGAGNDNIIGGAGNDIFNMAKGGEDTILAGAGDDKFIFGAAFDAGDTINGGTGNNTLTLNGNYTGANALVFGATTMTNVGLVFLSDDSNYDITTNDATVASGQTLTIQATDLEKKFSLTFDGSAETNGSFIIDGGAGIDTVIGGARNDTFNMAAGAGRDTIDGGTGDDTINLGSTFSDRTTIDGGVGNDLVNLTGNYMAGVVFLDTTMVNVETLQLGAGFNYRLTTSDATVAAGQTLTLQAQAVSTGHAVVFNGSAETDGSFVFDMGAGNDTVTGGAGDDVFNLTLGGNDHAHGGAGDDTFIMGATVHAPTILDGGDGNDVVDLAGNYTNLVFRATSLVSIETINLTGGFSYHMTMNDANVAAGQIMHINGAALTATDTFVFNGSAETDGRYFINGGAGNDHIIGGQGNDIIHAGAGNDVITGGGGQDVMLAGAGQDDFIYKAVMDSTSTNYDTIQGFDGSKDIFDFPFIVRGITTLTTGQLDLANFDTELSTVLSSSVLAGHHAVIFTPDSGTLKGDIFLVVDANNVAGYQAGQDYVIQLDSTSTNLNDITTASFH